MVLYLLIFRKKRTRKPGRDEKVNAPFSVNTQRRGILRAEQVRSWDCPHKQKFPAEDHSDGKFFSTPGSPRCPVALSKVYLAHLNPENDGLFQRPEESSDKFSSDICTVWFSARKLGHNTLENMLKIMTTRADILPYLTNHSIRATTITVLSSNNIETRKIKAVTGHRSDTSVENYCERPTLDQVKDMSNALSSYIDHETSEISPIPQSQLGNASLSLYFSTQSTNWLIPSSRSSSGQRYFSSQQENFLIESGCNLEAILPSGTFENCSFTFNINSNH